MIYTNTSTAKALLLLNNQPLTHISQCSPSLHTTRTNTMPMIIAVTVLATTVLATTGAIVAVLIVLTA